MSYTPVYPTVGELATMTAQQVFDRVSVHLLKQGGPAMVQGSCAYRGDGGTACAVGVLIPEALYSPEFEGEPVSHVGLVDTPLAPFVRAHWGILKELQWVHDTRDPPYWRVELGRVARMYDLSTAAMDAVPEMAA